MKAVQIGAGNIGRGFLGQLYFQSGFEITFIDADAGLVDRLNRAGRYAIEIVDPLQTVWISNYRAVRAGTDEAVQAIADADIASTSVGANVLPKIAPTLGESMKRRSRPLDVILAENLHRAAEKMREWTQASDIGFVEASVGRMVPLATDEQRRADPLRVRVEAFCELPVDGDAFLNPVPRIVGLQPRSCFAAYVDRKLYLHNAGHAAAAYLGALAGYRYLWEAMADASVAGTVEAAMSESCLGLHRRYGLDLQDLLDHAADLRRRFSSRALGDTVERVAADPLRKLAPEDRLVGPILLCLAEGVPTENLATALAAALLYKDPSGRLDELRRQLGIEGVLATVCKLPISSPATAQVLTAQHRLAG